MSWTLLNEMLCITIIRIYFYYFDYYKNNNKYYMYVY
jgi:hypothetical protein